MLCSTSAVLHQCNDGCLREKQLETRTDTICCPLDRCPSTSAHLGTAVHFCTCPTTKCTAGPGCYPFLIFPLLLRPEILKKNLFPIRIYTHAILPLRCEDTGTLLLLYHLYIQFY